MSQVPKRRRHTRISARAPAAPAAAPNAEQLAPPPTSAAGDLMDDLFGPMIVSSGRNDQLPEPLDTIDAADPEKEAEVIQLNEGLVRDTPLVSSLLAYKSYLSPFEEMAQAGMLPVDPVVEKIAECIRMPPPVPSDNYYAVRGLSQSVPSSAYEETRAAQARIQAQLNTISAGYEAWSFFDQYVETASARGTVRAREKADACFRRLTDQFVPKPTVLKPAPVSRALNAKWRDILTGELQAIHNRFMADTVTALDRFSSADEVDSVAEQFVDALVDPFIRRQLTIIERSNYDEMPLLASTLRQFFDAYLINAVAYLNTPAAQRETPTFEDQQITCFLANVLESYAAPEFLGVWLPAWLARNPQPPATEVALTTYVKKIVAYRQRQFEQRNVPSYLYFYTPMTEEDARRAYRTMIEADIALARARAVANVEHARSALTQYLHTPSAMFIEPSWLIYTLPSILFQMLDVQVVAMRSDIQAAYMPNRGESEELVAQLEEKRAQADAELTTHVVQLEERLALYGYTRARVSMVYEHAPSDGIGARGADDDLWSPYDLSYPLSPTVSATQIDRLAMSVARTSEDFNATAQQDRAHNIRRAIDQNYTLKLLERRRAELQYQLDELTSPVTDVPLVIVHDVHNTSSEVLIASVGLSQQLEKRILTMNESLLEPDERLAQDALQTARFRFTWIFTPRGAGDATTPLTELVVRDTVLPVGQLVDSYAPFLRDIIDESTHSSAEEAVLANIRYALSRAGVYRVEVRVEPAANNDNDGNTSVYRSLFKATVQVVAKCHRDNVVFEPMATGSGASRHACCWSAALATHEHEQYIEELVALVEHGPQAHKQLLETRANTGIGLWERIAAQAAQRGLVLPLPLPPWGSSSPTQLMQTNYEPVDVLRRRFTFEALYAAFRRRVGVVLQYVIGDSVQLTRRFPAAAEGAYTPEQLFNLYLDMTLTNVEAIAALRRDAGEYGITGSRGGGALRAHDDVRADVPDLATFTGLLRMTRVVIAAATPPAPKRSPDPLNNSAFNPSVDPGSVLTVVVAEPTPNNNESLVAVLARLAHPLSQLLMSERERAFFSGVERDFATFRSLFREARVRDAYWNRIECGSNGNYMERRTLYAPVSMVPAPQAVLSVEESECLDAELGRLSVGEVRRELQSHGDMYALLSTSMLIDGASLREYERLMQNCLVENDFAQLMRDRAQPHSSANRYVGHIDIAVQRLWRPAIGVCCVDEPSNRVIAQWIGAHSAVTDQPVPLVVGFTGRSSLGDGVYKRAYLRESGSQPTGRNVDFNGLRDVIEDACKHYGAEIDSLEQRVPAPSTEQIRTVVTNARVHCEQLALAFNYFAFASPPLPAFYEAHKLIEEITYGRQFRQLSFALPVL